MTVIAQAPTLAPVPVNHSIQETSNQYDWLDWYGNLTGVCDCAPIWFLLISLCDCYRPLKPSRINTCSSRVMLSLLAVRLSAAVVASPMRSSDDSR